MRGYSVIALCTILMQAQQTGPGGIPCELWPPGSDNPCLPPDPHPFFHFTVVLCFSVAIGLLGAYLLGAFKRERTAALNEDEARQWSESLSEALRFIDDLRGLALRKECTIIAKGLLLSVDYTLQSVRDYYVDCKPKEELALECIVAIMTSGSELRHQLGIIRLILILPPLAPYASRQTLKAVQQYKEFAKTVKGCNASLPDFPVLSILEL